MKTTIDRDGRLRIPKSIRKAAAILPGSEVNIRVTDGRIEIEPTALEVRLVNRGMLTAAVSRRRVAQLTPEVVGRTLDRLRRRGSDESE